MNWFTDIDNRLAIMRQYCIDASNADCTPVNKANSIASYEAQFDELESKIAAYKANTMLKESQMVDIIISDFTNVIISDVTYDPPIFKPSSPYPVGYSDYWDMYKMNGLVDAILGYVDSYFYEGCILGILGTTMKLQAAIMTANMAESADSMLRTQMIDFGRSFSLLNTLIYLTENFNLTGSFKMKTEVSENIYVNKHAREIIDSFNLDVYIPSYII